MNTWLCLGDSITDAGRFFSTDGLGSGYVKKLSLLLNKECPQIRLANQGVDGFTTARVLENAASHCTAYEPDVVTLLVGINDIGLMKNTNRTSAQQNQMMEKFARNYEQLLKTIKSYSPRLICTMEPFLFPKPLEYLSWFPLLDTMCQMIKQVSAKENVHFIPLREPLNQLTDCLGLDGVTVDGIHLTDQGHTFLADTLLDHIKKSLPICTSAGRDFL